MTTFYEDLSTQIDSIILAQREGAGGNELKSQLMELKEALKTPFAQSVTVNMECCTCGNTFVQNFVQGRYSLIRCPFCKSEAGHQTVKKIWDTAALFADVNSEISNNAKGLNQPPFQFDLISR